ncbi:YggU family protein [Candidatus Woesearchaeota archaeon CG1_02_57_44]|nr:MAG: YggU family protein [Candidatus Woesearchaeota archaeon CG1_02_57_44]PIN68714.1 MAG: YggU family protein [Candidatus Woesearchaeota archaeon CG11_big_fil_rev_8_21_14_0_20_57_5]
MAKLSGRRFAIMARPGASKTMLLGYDEARKAFRVAIAAPPDKGKANVELEQFLSKFLGAKVRVVAGASSRKKMLELSG